MDAGRPLAHRRKDASGWADDAEQSPTPDLVLYFGSRETLVQPTPITLR